MSDKNIPRRKVDNDPIITPTTGSGAISATYNPGVAFYLDRVTLHLSSAPITSENFTITLNAKDGSVYDTILLSIDLSANSVTDLLWGPGDEPLLCEAGDAIDIAYANTDGNTYGLRVVTRLA